MFSVAVCFLVCIVSSLHGGKAEIHGIRLRGGSTPGQGKVEVKLGAQWGSVCDDNWSISEASVVCRQLGFSGAIEALKNSPYGQARGPIWIKTVICDGTEDELSLCSYQEISKGRKRWYENTDVTECSYDHQAGVICEELPNPDADLIRVGDAVPSSWPPRRRTSLVTVTLNGEWMPICSETWTSKEAIVACRQAGLGFAELIGKMPATSTYLPETYSDAVHSIKCTGDESSLQQCEIKDEMKDCQSYGSVVCNDKSPDISINMTTLEYSIDIRSIKERTLMCAKSEMCLSAEGLLKSDIEMKNSRSERQLLVFSSAVQNFGTADFRPPPLEGGWYYHKCHRHYHSISEFAKYELRDQERNVVEVGHKVSFCLRDNMCVNPSSKKYKCSRWSKDGNQGISIGCTDVYSKKLDCQWIDVTDVAIGNYTLEINSNPNRLVPEQDYTNNFIVCDVEIKEKENKFAKNEIIATGSNCHHPADFEDYVPVNSA